MRRLSGAPLAHQLLIARLSVGLLKDKPDPLAHLDVFEREIMADIAALLVDADHAEGLKIRPSPGRKWPQSFSCCATDCVSWGSETATLRPATVS